MGTVIVTAVIVLLSVIIGFALGRMTVGPPTD